MVQRLQCGEPATLMVKPSPLPVLPSRTGALLHDASTSRAIERRCATALPAHTLMARAGLAVARLTMAIAPHAESVALCCGPGNNGGDGLIAALHLQRWRRSVQVFLAGDAGRLPSDAADAYRQAREAGVPIETALPSALSHDVVVDALLGLGGNRPPEGAIADAIGVINAAGLPVLAVDLPTGLHGETGAVLGREAVRATHTLALLTCKPGLFTGHGRDHAGRIWFDDLGATPGPELPAASLVGSDAVRALLPQRLHHQHKGSFGDVAVIGGAGGMTGAVVLAARAALAAGAGRVYVAALADPAPTIDAARPELMWRPLASLVDPRPLGEATVVCGCGGGDPVRGVLPPVLHHAARLVLDADAINALAGDAGARQTLRARAARGRPTVLTPHPLEAARLLGIDAGAVQADRLRAAAKLADELQACVVLKGSGTVLAAPGVTPRINPTGNARLASPGTGDVLAGWLGGLWAQHAAGSASAIDVASAAVWLHGAAAEGAPGDGPALLAGDLIGAIVDAGTALRAAA